MATATHHRRALVLLIAGCALALVGVLIASAGTQTRASLMAQLERPALRPAPGRGFSATFARVGIRGALKLTVNRAGVADPARLVVTGRDGRPITGARVTLTYSMPAMEMWRVYSSQLEPLAGAPGTYAATQGVLGMAGTWRIDVAIALPGRSPERFALRDHMPS